MLFELDEQVKRFKPVTGMTIVDSLGGSEKDLESYLKKTIGDLLFPEYLVFGNERRFQGEADLFAVNSDGDLIDAFEEHYGFRIDLTEFNKRQKTIIISHSSSEDMGRISLNIGRE